MIYLMDLLATSIFSVVGSMIAGRKGMDISGFLLLSTVTSLAGGTFRDAVILRVKPFWINDLNYFIVSCITCLIVFVISRFFRLS